MSDIITLDNKYIEYYLGYKCNLDCEYCDVDKSKVNTINDISKFEDIIKYHKGFVNDKLLKIILSGGEPTLFKNEVLEILKKYSNDFIFHIISNGKEIDTLLEFCKFPIEVTISYDGHKNDRGFDSFESLKKVHYTGKLKGVNITISNSNYETLYDTCKEIIDLCPYLISKEYLSNNLTGLKMEIVRQKRDFYKFDYNKFKEQMNLIINNISSNLHIFNNHSLLCDNFWEYENHLICEHETGRVSGIGCFQKLLNKEETIKNYENFCKKCKNTSCYAHNCPVTYEMIGSYENHPYCKLNDILTEVKTNYRIKTFLNKQLNSINYLELILTQNCNMNCKHCFEKDFYSDKRNTQVMSKETIDNIFERIINIESDKLLSLNLFGGEPILKSTLEIRNYLIEKIKQSNRKIELSLISNTYDITEEDIEWLKKIKELTHFLSWQVSIDSIKEYNDKTRVLHNNEGTFDKVIENIKRISPIVGKKNININSVITFDNIDGLPDWCIFLSKEMLFKHIGNVTFRLDQTRMSEMTLTERCKVSEIYNKIIEYYYEGLIAPEVIRRVFNISYETYLYHDKKTEHKLSCGICNSQVTIDYDGSLMPCHYFNDKELVFTNINNIESINPDIEKLYNLFGMNTPHFNPETGEKCEDCEFRFNCIRCKIEQFKHGDINKVSIFNCQYVKQIGKLYNSKLWDIFKPLTPDERNEFELDLEEIRKIFISIEEESPEFDEFKNLVETMMKIRREKIW